jgi:L-alanine-DL-glutamate epimerase-like enolase superfamily enzyme
VAGRHPGPCGDRGGARHAGRDGRDPRHRFEFREILERRAVDVIQADAGVCGGITEWLKIARAAALFDVPVAPHWHADLHTPLAAATPNCTTVEYFFLEGDVYNFERLLASRMQPANGRLPVPTAPGLGLDWDDDAIAHFALDRHTPRPARSRT